MSIANLFKGVTRELREASTSSSQQALYYGGPDAVGALAVKLLFFSTELSFACMGSLVGVDLYPHVEEESNKAPIVMRNR